MLFACRGHGLSDGRQSKVRHLADVSPAARRHRGHMRFSIWVDSGTPLEGRVVLEHGGTRPFAGWLDLLAVLSEVVAAVQTPVTADASPVATDLGVVAGVVPVALDQDERQV